MGTQGTERCRWVKLVGAALQLLNNFLEEPKELNGSKAAVQQKHITSSGHTLLTLGQPHVLWGCPFYLQTYLHVHLQS